MTAKHLNLTSKAWPVKLCDAASLTVGSVTSCGNQAHLLIKSHAEQDNRSVRQHRRSNSVRIEYCCGRSKQPGNASGNCHYKAVFTTKNPKHRRGYVELVTLVGHNSSCPRGGVKTSKVRSCNLTSADLAPLVRESVERDPTIAANHLWPCIKEHARIEWSANMLARLKETAAKELGFRATAFESASNLARIKLSAGGDHFGHAIDLFMVDAAKMRTVALHAAKLRHDLVQKCGGLPLSIFSQCLSSQHRAPANEPSTMFY